MDDKERQRLEEQEKRQRLLPLFVQVCVDAGPKRKPQELLDKLWQELWRMDARTMRQAFIAFERAVTEWEND